MVSSNEHNAEGWGVSCQMELSVVARLRTKWCFVDVGLNCCVVKIIKSCRVRDGTENVKITTRSNADCLQVISVTLVRKTGAVAAETAVCLIIILNLSDWSPPRR